MGFRERLDNVLMEIQQLLVSHVGADNGRVLYEQIVNIVEKEFPKERLPAPELVKEYEVLIKKAVWEVAQRERVHHYFGWGVICEIIFSPILPQLITSLANRHSLLIDEMLKRFILYVKQAREGLVASDYRSSSLYWTRDAKYADGKIKLMQEHLKGLVENLNARFEETAHNSGMAVMQSLSEFESAGRQTAAKAEGDLASFFPDHVLYPLKRETGEAQKRGIEDKIAAIMVLSFLSYGIELCYLQNP